jgi:hypothetical protein
MGEALLQHASTAPSAPTTTADELKRTHYLIKQIEKAVRLIAVYRVADEVLVSAKATHHNGSEQLDNQIALTGAEISEPIVAALKQRLTAMQNELQKLGLA